MERRIYLLRHAEPYFENQERRCIGRADIPLSETGKVQAQKIGQWIRERDIKHIYTSPLKRCIQTTWQVVSETKKIQIEPGLQEMGMGKWENLTFAEIKSRYPQEYEERGKAMGYYAPPGGESFYQAGLRFWKTLDKIRKKAEGNILIVSHAGVMRGYLCILQGLSLNSVMTLPQPYAGVNILVEKEGAVSVEQTGYQPKVQPEKKDIEALYHKCNTPDRVILHMEAVAGLVENILKQMDPQKKYYDHDLLIKAALVHDILRTERNHAEAGASFMRKEGFGEIAMLIAEHHSDICSNFGKPTMSELLFYADKRVLENSVVSVEERFLKSRKKCHTFEGLEKHRRLYEKSMLIERKIEKQLKEYV